MKGMENPGWKGPDVKRGLRHEAGFTQGRPVIWIVRNNSKCRSRTLLFSAIDTTIH